VRPARNAAILMAMCLLAGLPAVAAAGPFRSPSGNIGCFLGASAVRCDINRHDWSAPPKPASCELDFGQGVSLGHRGRASFVCAGDTALNVGPRLAYGKSIRRGSIRCRSLRSQMRCDNVRTGHGFTLSRQRVRVF
jgi:hypothetical protein